MKKTIILGLITITLALTSSVARAGDVRFSFHIGLPLPTFCAPAPVPAPVCVTTPVYVAPPVCAAPPVVYVPSGYCRPAVVYGGYHHPNYVRHHVRYYNPHCGY